MTEIIAVIPAPRWVEGVPRKNVRRVGGVPLVARAIVAATAATRVDRVVVSTDDEEIAAIAQEWGAQVIRRPAVLSGDEATSESALLHALDALEGSGVQTSTLVLLQPTSPFIDSVDLDAAIQLVRDGSQTVSSPRSRRSGFSGRSARMAWLEVSTTTRACGRDDRTASRAPRDRRVLRDGCCGLPGRAPPLLRPRRARRSGRAHAIEIDSEEQLAMAQALAVSIPPDTELMDVAAVVTDFDGVHTDDTALVAADGHELVRVSRSDGMGVARLRRAGIPVLILSTETDLVVTARARKLQVDVRQGVDDKAEALREWVAIRAFRSIGSPISETTSTTCRASNWSAGRSPSPCAPSRPRRRARHHQSAGRPRGRAGSVRRVLRGAAVRGGREARTPQCPPKGAIMTVTIGSRVVGGGHPAYVIAEIGLNHNGNVDLAKQLIDVAADAGVEAVKFQKRTPEISTPAAMRELGERPRGER